MVHIPVGLYKATQDNDIKFNQLCKNDSRIQYKKVCSSTGKEVDPKDIVKGFKYSDSDDYVILTEDDFENAKSEKDRGIHILHFADLEQIPPIFFDQSYHIAPEKGGEKAFSLLRQAMLDDDFIICGYVVKEHIRTLVLGQYVKGKLAYKGKVAGISKSVFNTILKVPKASCPFPQSPKDGNIIWIKPELVCKVQFMEYTKSGGMRQPAFVALRDDKRLTDCMKEF